MQKTCKAIFETGRVFVTLITLNENQQLN